jgi:uncharacterized protein (TIGR02598 family)
MKLPRGFTLVEVVMALAIFSFAIIALFGLMSAGLRNSRESGADLALGLMTQTAISTLNAEGFTAAKQNASYGDATTPDFFFDSDGKLIVNTAGEPVKTQPADGLYACTILRSVPSNLNTTNTILLRLEFAWPLSAPVTNRQKKAILTSLSRHD